MSSKTGNWILEGMVFMITKYYLVHIRENVVGNCLMNIFCFSGFNHILSLFNDRREYHTLFGIHVRCAVCKLDALIKYDNRA